MAIPIKYNLRSLRVRWRATLATMLGIALVVAVFIMVMALARGMQATFINTGDPRNLLVLRKGSTAESASQISRDEARRIKYLDSIARTEQGEPLASAEIIVLILLDRQGGGSANVLVRGTSPAGLALRPQLRVVEGRMFQAGLRECIVSTKIASRFENCRVGETFRSGKDEWHVVGIFDAQRTAYESEIWVDADEAREAFNRNFYGSVLLRPADETVAALLVERVALEKQANEKPPPKSAGWLNRRMGGASENPGETAKANLAELEKRIGKTIIGRIENDNMLSVKVQSEAEYFRGQTQSAGLLQFLASFLSVIMSIGAAFAAMNTMYAAVGARTREIGTLRVLGFRRREIYASILIESILLSFFGGLIGCAASLPLNGLATGTFSPTTFAEVAFEFCVTGELLFKGMLFALIMGVLGGLLPARLAARKPVLAALRAV